MSGIPAATRRRGAPRPVEEQQPVLAVGAVHAEALAAHVLVGLQHPPGLPRARPGAGEQGVGVVIAKGEGQHEVGRQRQRAALVEVLAAVHGLHDPLAVHLPTQEERCQLGDGGLPFGLGDLEVQRSGVVHLIGDRAGRRLVGSP